MFRREPLTNTVLVQLFIAAVLVAPPTHSARAQGFDPVSLVSDTATIRLSVLGTFRGGMYSKSTPTYPVYDPRTQRVFVGSADRNRVDVIDVSDPTAPKLHSSIDSGEPGRIAMSQEGILAVTGSSRIRFYNANGDALTSAIFVRGVGDLEFTPDGTKLIVNQTDSISVLDLGGADFANCRLGQPGCNLNPTIATASLDVFNSMRAELLAAGVRLPFSSRTVAQNLDPASLSVTPDGQAAWISLIDSNALLKLDLQTNEFTELFGLGAKDNSLPGNGFDASDQDGGINIQTWPMKTFYEPDGIGTYTVAGQTYVVTANEGDARGDANGDFHVRLSTLTLDATAFPNAAALQSDSQLGRLRVSRIDGDPDGDGDLDEIYGFGTRSFSIWSTGGDLLFDSGDDFEQITALAVPASFNATEDSNTLDARSDDRGPEPEVLDVGTIAGRSYVFVGFERISGIMAYDVTDPLAPSFQQYINNRNFAVDPGVVCGTRGEGALSTCGAAGDLETEGVRFVPADQSPISVPMLVVSHEASDSTTLYRIDVIPEPSTLTLIAAGLLSMICCRRNRAEVLGKINPLNRNAGGRSQKVATA